MTAKLTPGGQADLYEGQAVWVTAQHSNYYRRVAIITSAHDSKPGVWVSFGKMARRYLALDEFSVFESGDQIRKGDPDWKPTERAQTSAAEDLPSPSYNRFKAVIEIRQAGGQAEIYTKGGPLVVLRQPFNLLYWKILEIKGDLTILENEGAKRPLSSEEVQEEFQKAIRLMKSIKTEEAEKEREEKDNVGPKETETSPGNLGV